ncbi:MAG: DUF2207 domain-containing protein [Pseudomonadota bacterium]
MSIRHLLAALAIVVASIGAAATSNAAEQINAFNVAITVETDGDIIVTETIDVTSEGQAIRRGIFRDLPRFYESDGARLPYQYKILNVTRNEAREPYDVDVEGNARRVRIGDADVLLARGRHVYQLRYEVKNQVRYFADYDEVYWNATGADWAFPILSARAVATLPDGGTVRRAAAYTGRQGEAGEAYRYRQDGNSHVFETTRRLAAREGLTIAVGFDKGLIDPPSAADRRSAWWGRNGALAILFASLAGVFAFYWRSFNKVGRDPQKKPIIPRYAPPEGYSPAAAHHVFYRGLRDHKALIATLMHLAVNKRLEIDASDKKKTRLTRADAASTETGLSPPELDLESDIFRDGPKKTIGGATDKAFTKAYETFRKAAVRTYGAPYFKWNLGYTMAALALSLGALIFALALHNEWTGLHTGALLAIAAVNGLFMYLMPAPTEKGQKIRTEIEGFRLYLETAEKLQLNAVAAGTDAPPPMTTERYERFLPYAVALGVEKPWTQHFERLIPTEAAAYSPTWMHGSDGARSMGAMNKALVANMTSGVVSAMPQSSGSSGSGGGGFSGGGGGGGGGGGW